MFVHVLVKLFRESYYKVLPNWSFLKIKCQNFSSAFPFLPPWPQSSSVKSNLSSTLFIFIISRFLLWRLVVCLCPKNK